MSNKNLTARVNLSYVTPGDQTIRMPEMTVRCPYQSYNVGVVDVPDQSAQAATFDVPFGAVEKPSFLVINNRLAQDVTCTITSGVTALTAFTVTAGGAVMFAVSAVDSQVLTSIQLALSALQDGDGSIECFVFGDAT